jgi:GntR family transcriptional repressor for pyruvate dehydrogenase complex
MVNTNARFSPVARRTVAAEVREAIAQSIRRGELAPGSRLPSERDLTEQFSVARTSVREAIQGLISVGLLEKRGNRSYVVEHLPDIRFDGNDRRKRRVQELFEVRQLVEVPIARLAACRADDAHRAEIARIADQFDDEMELGEFRELDRAFHWALARACGNDTLAELYGKVLDSLFASSEFDDLLTAESNRLEVREIIRGSIAAHRDIAVGILEHDWARVVESVERHLDSVEHQMISRLT